jgi:subtilase family serine protease
MTSSVPIRSRLFGALIAAATVLGVTAVALPASAAPRDGRPLAGSTPRWLARAHRLGATPAGQRVSFGVLLKMRDPAGAAATLQSISSPGSASYGHWLSGAAFKAAYGPAGGDVTAVQNWLRSQGFQLARTLPSGMLVEATGSVAQVEKTFSTAVNDYSYLGTTVRANASQLSLPAGTPAAVSNVVAGVVGIDQGSTLKKPAATEPGPPPGARYGVQPCSAYYGQKTATAQPPAYGVHQPYATCGYGPQQFQSAYGETTLLRSGITGKGVTVAITDAYAAPTILQDAQRYSKVHHQPLLQPGQFSQITPAPDGYDLVNECDAQGWYGEETLDVEAVHAVAPDANIVYVAGASCNDNDLLDALTKVVDHHLASIVSNSWGDIEENETPDVAAAYDQVFLNGAVQGIGFYFSSGDAGDNVASSGKKQVDTPGNSPWATSVGGTSLAVGKHDSYEFETGWGTEKGVLSADGKSWATPAYTSGAGGGTSSLYGQPFYQRGVVPNALSKANGGKDKMRVEPDIAAVADPNTGFLVGQTQTFLDGSVKYGEYRIGGTSLAAPVIAGVQALTQQARFGIPIGFANPLIYSRYGTSAYHDVTDHPFGPQTLSEVRVDFANGENASDGTITSLRVLGRDASLAATRGYDDVTGVGTPTSNYVDGFRRH